MRYQVKGLHVAPRAWRRKDIARSSRKDTALFQAAMVLSHRQTPAVYGLGRQAGAYSGNAGATPPATLAAQPRTCDTPTDAQSGVRGFSLLFMKILCQGASGFVPYVVSSTRQ